MKHLHRRARASALSALAAGTLATTLAATLVGAAGPSYSATTGSDPRPGREALHWLGTQADSAGLQQSYGYPDQGKSIDAGLSDEALNRGPDAVAIADALAKADPSSGTPQRTYLQQYVDYTAGTTSYPAANAMGKALAFAYATGQDPSSWGGVDLVSLMQDHTDDTTGQITDGGSGDDYANMIGQVFAVRGLSEATSPEAPQALDFLSKKQCPEGYFNLNFSDSCTSTDTPGADVTALAAIELADVPEPAAQTIVTQARQWLRKYQRSSGGWAGGTGSRSVNANSTGLAAWALSTSPATATDMHAAARRGALWLRRHQAHPAADCPGRLSGARGAIAYDDATLSDARSGSTTPNGSDQWSRATAQGAAGLRAAAPAAGALRLSGPGGWHRAGSRLALTAHDVAPGDDFCIRWRTERKAGGLGEADNATTRTVRLPQGTSERIYRLTDSGGRRTQASFKVLGPTRLRVALGRRTARPGSTIGVTVRGLFPGEPVHLRFHGRAIADAVARRDGTYYRRFRVTRPIGDARVFARGRYADIRRGSAPLRVIR